jgi:[ribosomal protein S18]-alanine N-acetyltransferase
VNGPPTIDIGGRSVVIREIGGADEIDRCAEIMATSEPWITLGRTRDQATRVLSDREVQEVYVAVHRDAVVGFVILVLKGAFVGYIRTIAVEEDWRSRGLGRRLISFAEERIFRDSPNVFICVSSFNPRARALYERLGYELIGELRDYIIPGNSELIMRKTLGPYSEFRREKQ